MFYRFFYTASFRILQKSTNRQVYQSIVACTDNRTNTNKNNDKDQETDEAATKRITNKTQERIITDKTATLKTATKSTETNKQQ